MKNEKSTFINPPNLDHGVEIHFHSFLLYNKRLAWRQEPFSITGVCVYFCRGSCPSQQFYCGGWIGRQVASSAGKAARLSPSCSLCSHMDSNTRVNSHRYLKTQVMQRMTLLSVGECICHSRVAYMF